MSVIKSINSSENQSFLIFAILFCGVSSALFYLLNMSTYSLGFLVVAGLLLVKKNCNDLGKETKLGKSDSPFHA